MAIVIQDRWLKGLIEALDEAKISYTPDRNGLQEFLEIESLNMMIGPLGFATLSSCPINGNQWDFSHWNAHAYGPLDLGRMIIRKSKRLEG